MTNVPQPGKYEGHLFVWSLVFVVYALSVMLAYSLGHADGKAVRKVCPPPPPISALQCAAVWFGGESNDMALVRQRVCPSKKGKS